MRFLLGSIGGLAALVLIGSSIAMNFTFGQSLGVGEFEKMAFGGASASADILKVVIPFALFAAFAAGRYVTSVACFAGLLIFTSWSFTSSIGFASLNRAATTGDRAVETRNAKGWQADIARKRLERGWVPSHRPAATVQGDIATLKTNRRWDTSKGCTDATAAASRILCGEYGKLKAELGAARTSSRLDGEIAALASKLATVKGVSAKSKAGDPQVETIAGLTGYSVEHVSIALAIVLAILVEFGSVFGLYAMSALFVAKAKRAVQARDVKPAANDDSVVEIMPKGTAPKLDKAKPLPWTLPPKVGAKQVTEPKVAKLALVASNDAPAADAYEGKDLSDVRKTQCSEFANSGLVINGDKGTRIVAGDLYRAYEIWAAGRGFDIMPIRVFGTYMTEILGEQGVTRLKSNGRQVYCGVRFEDTLARVA